MNATPTKLGKYDIAHEIARGSMGVVYQGYDPFIDRPVAIKVAIAEGLRDREHGERFRKMFFNEAHTAGRLRHPNILDIYDAGVDEETCYIVMELVRGGNTLKAHTRGSGLLPVNRVVEILFKCAKALDYAHRQGVIHRDVKPSNILLTEDLDVKLADFSIAHASEADASRTMPMGFVGSPRYMSPEQVQEELVSHQTDLFSLGVVAYEMLTGRHPFAADSFSRLIYRLVNEAPIPLREQRSDLPPALETVVMKALCKDPLGRYRCGLDLAADLSGAFSYLERVQAEVSTLDQFDRVATLAFFREFQDTEIWEIMRASLWVNVEAGQTVIREGDIEDCFYIIVSGELEVRKSDRLVAELKTGDCFGEMGYLERCRRSASVVARSASALMKINSTLVERVSRECQLRFSRVFLHTLTQRLASITERYAAG